MSVRKWTLLLIVAIVSLALFPTPSSAGHAEVIWRWNPANNHYYTLTSPNWWTWLEPYLAADLNGHLVTINNHEEEEWLLETFADWPYGAHGGWTWIGLSDSFRFPVYSQKGNWVWSSGQHPAYSHWCADRPLTGDEDDEYDWAVMWMGSAEPGRDPGCWFDMQARGDLPGIVERQGAPPAVAGSVVNIRGSVWVSGVRVSSPPVQIETRDEIVTGPDGYVKLATNEGEFVLGPDSSLTIGEYSSFEQRLELLKGKLYARLAQVPEERWKIMMPQAIAGVRGTEFVVEAGADNSTVKVLEGLVRVSLPYKSAIEWAFQAEQIVAGYSQLNKSSFDPTQMERWWDQWDGTIVVAGRVTHVEGSVTIDDVLAQVGTSIAGDAVVEAASDGLLAFQANGMDAIVDVGPDSGVTVRSDPQTQATTLDLVKGKILAKMKNLAQSGNSLEIRTPECVIGVRGTEVVAETSGTGSRILVLEGEVNVSTSDGRDSIDLPESHGVLVSEEGLGEPFPVDPASVDRWWPEQVIVSVASPVDLCVIDPQNRAAGSCDGSFVPVPEASYTGPEAVPEEIIIAYPAYGHYQVQLLPTGNGSYELAMVQDLRHGMVVERSIGVVVEGSPIGQNLNVEAYEVIIDIKPGSDPNSINLGSRGVVPVVLLTTDVFSADRVDPATVTFAGAAPLRWATEDSDADGDGDLIFTFDTEELDLDTDSSKASLTGTTRDGIRIAGASQVNIVP